MPYPFEPFPQVDYDTWEHKAELELKQTAASSLSTLKKLYPIFEIKIHDDFHNRSCKTVFGPLKNVQGIPLGAHLLQNLSCLYKARQLNKSGHLCVYLDPGCVSSFDRESNLFRQFQVSLSAFLGGADEIFIWEESLPGNPQQQQRLGENCLRILQLESGIRPEQTGLWQTAVLEDLMSGSQVQKTDTVLESEKEKLKALFYMEKKVLGVNAYFSGSEIYSDRPLISSGANHKFEKFLLYLRTHKIQFSIAEFTRQLAPWKNLLKAHGIGWGKQLVWDSVHDTELNFLDEHLP